MYFPLHALALHPVVAQVFRHMLCCAGNATAVSDMMAVDDTAPEASAQQVIRQESASAGTAIALTGEHHNPLVTELELTRATATVATQDALPGSLTLQQRVVEPTASAQPESYLDDLVQHLAVAGSAGSEDLLQQWLETGDADVSADHEASDVGIARDETGDAGLASEYDDDALTSSDDDDDGAATSGGETDAGLDAD